MRPPADNDGAAQAPPAGADDAERFLRALFGGVRGGFVEARPLPVDRAQRQFLSTEDLAAVVRAAQAADAAGANAYVGINPRCRAGWSSRHRWVDRARSWDEELDRQGRATELDAVREMRRRHVELALDCQKAAEVAIRKLRAKLEAEDGGTLSVADAVRLAELGTELERLSRGEPGQIEEQRIEPPVLHDFGRLASAELRQLRALLRKASADATPLAATLSTPL